MKIAISGSEGFLGKHLVKVFKAKQDIELLLLDLKNDIDLAKKQCLLSIDYFDVIIHLAGLSYVPDSFQDPMKFYETNFLTTLHALELCRRNKAKMIFISSYVYGKPVYLPIDEHHPVNPFNPYAQSKIIGEKLCEGYFRDFEIPCIILRPFNIYGEGQNPNFIIPQIVSQIMLKQETIHLKDPSPRRDFIHIKDVIRAIEFCVNNNTISFEIFNIASGISYSILEISEIFKELLGPNQIIKFSFDKNEIRKNEVNETRGSFSKIQSLLGWEPNVTLHDGLKSLFAI